MKYIKTLFTFLFTFLFFQTVVSQTDFSENWKDLYSYNRVQDFTVINNRVYGASNHAVFTYDIDSGAIEKISTVNGLSGDEINFVSYDAVSDRIVLGYQNGLIEIITNQNKVIPTTGIRDNQILTNNKGVGGFYRDKETSYVFGEFGILVFNIEDRSIGDSYRLSLDSSSPLNVNQIVIKDNILYAATDLGLYSVDLDLSPIDFNNWIQVVSGSVANVLSVSDEIFFSKDSNVFTLTNPTNNILSAGGDILSLNIYTSTRNYLNITTATDIFIMDPNNFNIIDSVDLSLAANFNISTTKSIIIDNDIFLNTSTSGILKTSLTDKINYEEIHPDGPSANDMFDITVSENQIWTVYGRYDGAYNGLGQTRNIDYLRNDKWTSLEHTEFGNTTDCITTIVDPLDESKVLVASLHKGIVEFNAFQYETSWFSENTNGELPGHRSVGGAWTTNMIADNNNNIWTANSFGLDLIYFTKYNGENEGANRWESNVSFLNVTGSEIVRGFNKMFVDQNNNVFACSARNGLYVFNADFPNQRVIFDDSENQGQLPSTRIRSVVVDENEKLWIGTNDGLVVFDDYANLYATSKQPVGRVVIEVNGENKNLFRDRLVNDILIDGSSNKWFATDAGVFQTSSSGDVTFNNFTTANSPLPEDNVIDLEIDKNTGLVYMVTDGGVLVYDPNTEPFKETPEITDVVAYPNPAVRGREGHEVVRIVTKDGKGLPEGTNVKILDVSGKLVTELNITNNGEVQGSSIEWDKRNLGGSFVASGVYIVLVSSADGSENTTTKIAIVN